MTSPSFTCPRCGITSWNKMDVREGYCGRCHDWTGAQRRVEDPFSRDEHVERPGLRVHAQPIDAGNARQMTFVGTESTAVHSRSKGWLPMVALSLTHEPLVGEGAVEGLMLMLGRADVEPPHLPPAGRADRRAGRRRGRSDLRTEAGMSARDENPFDMADPHKQWWILCDRIDALRAEVERWKLIASEHERTA